MKPLPTWPTTPVRNSVPFVALGNWPTPIQELAGPEISAVCAPIYAKRDDLSSPLYGGNKVRVLEVLCAEALERGHRKIVTVGASGSNHNLATAIHAPRVGLETHAISFPQPKSAPADENDRRTREKTTRTRIPHWSVLPAAAWWLKHRDHWLRSSEGHDHQRGPYVMTPGGASPTGALAYVDAAFEVARQVHNGHMPAPTHIVLPVGSTCTMAGLIAGFLALARPGFLPMPHFEGVRVTPWPVTSRQMVGHLVAKTIHRLDELGLWPGRRLSASATMRTFEIVGDQIGAGYGHPTSAGRRARRIGETLGLELDVVYAGKAFAHVLARRRSGRDVVLFWCTKSAV